MKNRFKFRAFDGSKMIYDSPTLKVLNRFDDENCMQCIGQKDKNNNLIYEGDILIGSAKDYRYRVGYNDCKNEYCIKQNNSLYAESIKEFVINCMEIVGNIHENKELLNT